LRFGKFFLLHLESPLVINLTETLFLTCGSIGETYRIHTIQTDNGHEFQAKFHWHVEDLSMRHVYIKPAMPHLNGKVERSHGIDKEEFYQMLNYKNDVDLDKKIREWENFYNYQRPHGSLKGKTPYEILKIKLSC